MSEREICERISAWFEPKPNFTRTRELLEKRWYDSPKRCWTLHRHSGQPIESIDSWYWLPISWDTDEAANARLLEAMIAEQVEHGISYAEAYFVVCEEIAAFMRDDRKDAVVRCFYKRAGLDSAEG